MENDVYMDTGTLNNSETFLKNTIKLLKNLYIMEKYGRKAFKSSLEVVEYFNNNENSNKELLSVCAIAPTLCDSTFVAFYRNKEEYVDVIV